MRFFIKTKTISNIFAARNNLANVSKKKKIAFIYDYFVSVK